MNKHWLELDRRQLVALGTVGLAALAIPGSARAMMAQGFTHNVASGEPTATSVLLWTRYAAANDVSLRCEIAADSDFKQVQAGGDIVARGENDHCVKFVATGLTPGRWYYYRFIAEDGRTSPTGRTRTLPVGPVARFGLGLFSCSNLPFGYFNAYGHAAARGDLDLMIHVGDYLYEYAVGTYPGARQAVPGQLIQPAHEIVTLADYRLRYAAYRSDPDLQRLHQLFPVISQWDDHELTNDAWMGGAENHQSDREGDWGVRKAVAERAYNEWMPVSGKRWRDYDIGDLATIFLPETRISGREQPFDLNAMVRDSANPAAALKQFQEGAWRNPSRQLLGKEQEQWLFGGLRQSVRSGKKWQIAAQQILMGDNVFPAAASGWFGSDLAPEVAARVRTSEMTAAAGLPLSMDMWGGYPAARSRLFRAAQQAGANFVSLAGDSHNGWAFDLAEGGRPVGVEFGGQSVTSPGYEGITNAKEDDRVAALRGASPQLRWANTRDRGYMSIEVTTAAMTGEWHFLDTVRARSLKMKGSHRMTVRHGRRRFEAA